eukprot:COSAG01_NODE_20824_length_933_cov_1.744604_1_plen_238_part_10
MMASPQPAAPPSKRSAGATVVAAASVVKHCRGQLQPPLPYLDDQLWAAILSFLGAVDLGRVRCVSARFTRSLVDAGARLALEAWPAYVRAWVPPRPGAHWLQLLAEADVLLNTPLAFTEHGPAVTVVGTDASRVESRQDGTHTTWPYSHTTWQAAVCRLPRDADMRAGVHCAAFRVVTRGHIETPGDVGSWVGVVGNQFDAQGGGAAMHSTDPGPAAGPRITKGCMLYTSCIKAIGLA